ncbi:MAG: DNA polymerase I [Acidimicrobiales bacterium]
MERDLLLDGHSLAYRAWFALQEAQLSTASGQETQAVFGFVSMLAKLLEDQSPTGMAVAFDRREPTFRDALAATYKAGRPTTPEPLLEQIELIRRLVETLGVPAVDAEGYEADDVIATLATRLSGEGHEVVIVTGDRDAYQLVCDPLVKVLYNRRGVTDYVLYDEAGIEERTGVRPELYPFLASLRGDPSDNLPGVPGVGDKIAARLVNTYGDVDALYAHLEEQTPRLRASLADHEAQVRLNLQMTPLVRDVPLACVTDDLVLGRSKREEMRSLFELLEIRGPRDRIFKQLDRLEPLARRAPGVGGDGSAGPGATSAPSPESASRPVLIVLLEELEGARAWLSSLAASPDQVAIEAVWAGAPGRSAVEGLALAALEETGVPAGDEERPEDRAVPNGRPLVVGWLEGRQIAEPGVVEALQNVLGARRDGALRVVAHRAKEIMRALEPQGVRFTGLDLDTAVAAYLLDAREGQASLSGLASLVPTLGSGAGQAQRARVTEQLGFDLGNEDSADDQAGEADATPPDARQAAAQVAMLGRLAPAIRRALEETGATRLYEDVERPLIRVLAKMELAGIAVDIDKLRAIGDELTSEARRLEAEVQQLAGEEFNVNSTPQLRRILFDKLQLVPQKRTKTGYSTDAQSLLRLRDAHPLVDTLLRYREVEKLRSTYGEGLLAEVAPDGRIHASFNQTVARTGRLSSDQPNLHNIPVRSLIGRRFREAFVPSAGCELLIADYDQIELRVIAHLADDPGLVGAFRSGLDIHNTTAARVYGVEASEVTLAMRSKAKMISYGLAYGMEAYGLSRRLGVGVEEAAGILAQYFAAFPNVKQYMERSVAEARGRGYTETLLGRRRYLPELDSSNFRVRQAAERQAMNAGIQGLAADIFKVALVRLDKALEESGLSSRIVLQVHDEILVEAVDGERDDALALTVETMEHAFELRVPLAVHVAVGDSWAAGKEPAVGPDADFELAGPLEQDEPAM